MCNCGGSKGTSANQTSATLGDQTQQVQVPQSSPEEIAQARQSIGNALSNANS
jgi:hypothetical protein